MPTLTIDGSALEPIVTWGVNPGQSIGIGGRMPSPNDVAPDERQGVVGVSANVGVDDDAVEMVGACIG